MLKVCEFVKITYLKHKLPNSCFFLNKKSSSFGPIIWDVPVWWPQGENIFKFVAVTQWVPSRVSCAFLSLKPTKLCGHEFYLPHSLKNWLNTFNVEKFHLSVPPVEKSFDPGVWQLFVKPPQISWSYLSDWEKMQAHSARLPPFPLNSPYSFWSNSYAREIAQFWADPKMNARGKIKNEIVVSRKFLTHISLMSSAYKHMPLQRNY